jgi:hypothetical protein
MRLSFVHFFEIKSDDEKLFLLSKNDDIKSIIFYDALIKNKKI